MVQLLLPRPFTNMEQLRGITHALLRANPDHGWSLRKEFEGETLRADVWSLGPAPVFEFRWMADGTRQLNDLRNSAPVPLDK